LGASIAVVWPQSLTIVLVAGTVMSRLQEALQGHYRSCLWQILPVYIGASCALLATTATPAAGQVADTLISVRQGVYTEEQARRGAVVYERACGACHMQEYFTGSFLDSWNGAPASMLFELFRTTMPEDRPGGLDRREYADVLAYIFKLNGLPHGQRELPPRLAALERIVIERRE
jgi:mono/diheme cytochrome c family protein